MLPGPLNLPAAPTGEAASIARYARLQRLAGPSPTYPTTLLHSSSHLLVCAAGVRKLGPRMNKKKTTSRAATAAGQLRDTINAHAASICIGHWKLHMDGVETHLAPERSPTEPNESHITPLAAAASPPDRNLPGSPIIHTTPC